MEKTKAKKMEKHGSNRESGAAGSSLQKARTIALRNEIIEKMKNNNEKIYRGKRGKSKRVQKGSPGTEMEERKGWLEQAGKGWNGGNQGIIKVSKVSPYAHV